MQILLYTIYEVKEMRERSQRFDPRQAMRSNSFEVFHYREPRPNPVEVHHHDFYEVYFLLGGQVSYWVDGRILRMEQGDLLLINPLELHRPVLEEGQTCYERIVLWVDKDFLMGLGDSQQDLCACFDTGRKGHTHLIRPGAAERSALTAQLASLVREFYSLEYGSQLSAYGQFLQFMVQLNRMALNTRQEQETAQQHSELTQKVLKYIAEHLSEPLSLDVLADRFYVSKYYLSHAFTREVGVSVYRYLMMRRLLLARQLLLAGEPAGQVCRSCGFSDYTSFYRAFKSEYGISPRDFAAGG